MKKSGTLKKTAIWFAAILLIALLAFFAVNRVSGTLEENRAASLKEAVLKAASQCYAVEGVYPEGVDYLEEHYGLLINHDRYIISYDCCGSNRMPQVMVLRK